MADETEGQVPSEAEILEEGSQQEPGESTDVSGSETAQLKEALEKAEKAKRDFQGEKDRETAARKKAEDELKKLQRQDMSEVEALQAELKEKEEELERERGLTNFLSFKTFRQEMAAKYKIPKRLEERLTGASEFELEANAKEFAEALGDLGLLSGDSTQEQPPGVPSGAGAGGAESAENEIQEALKRGNHQEAVRLRLARRKS